MRWNKVRKFHFLRTFSISLHSIIFGFAVIELDWIGNGVCHFHVKIVYKDFNTFNFWQISHDSN